jgi:type II secretory pathway pseudopilin PulG
VRGFSLVETLTAIVILACALLALAPLMTMGTGASGQARSITTATLLAVDSVEALRHSGALVASPADALDRNAPGFHDFFDPSGAPIVAGGGGAVPAGAAFVRRWSIAITGAPLTDQITIQVAVMPLSAGGAMRRATARHRGEVRLAAIIGRAP